LGYHLFIFVSSKLRYQPCTIAKPNSFNERTYVFPSVVRNQPLNQMVKGYKHLPLVLYYVARIGLRSTHIIYYYMIK